MKVPLAVLRPGYYKRLFPLRAYARYYIVNSDPVELPNPHARVPDTNEAEFILSVGLIGAPSFRRDCGGGRSNRALLEGRGGGVTMARAH